MREVAAGERARLEELARYAILDTPPEPELDAVCGLAALLFDVPTAVISFIDADRQWFKARRGLALAETPRAVAFCARTIESSDLLVVEDATQDHRFIDNPLVVGPPHVRFYAGAPLETPAGLRIGTVAIFDSRSHHLEDSQKRLLRALGDLVVARLEERRRALGARGNAAPATAEAGLHVIVEQLPAVLWTTDRELRITSVRGAGLAQSGMSADQLLGVRLGTQSEEYARSIAAHTAALRGDSVTFDFAWRDRAYHIHLEPLRDADRAVVGTLGLALDITEQHRAKESLRRSNEELRLSEERSRLISRATSDVVWDWDIGSDSLTWNDGITSVFGHPRAEVGPHLGWWRERVAPADRERLWADVQRVLAAGEDTWSGEYRFLCGDGRWADVLDRGFVIRDAEGRPVRMVGAMLDVTARNKLQARLRQADRLASVGTLAAGVAHEINNPLSYITANIAFAVGVIERLGGVNEDLAEAKQALTDAARGAERVRKIVQDLRIFARGNDDRPELIDLAKLLGAALEITKNTLRHAASVQLRIEAPPPVFANEAQLAQVFVNLLVNAAEAIGVGHADRHRIEVRALRGAEGFAVVEIADDGPGIPAATLPHVFDPFFTTKPIGSGSGLGLAICHGIVDALGGRIEIASTVGKGTTVKVTLPAGSRAERRTPSEARAEAAPDRRRRLLIVDDEPQVLSALRRLLMREHEVVTEAEGAAVLGRLQAGEDFDVILCDVMMPRMGGVELFEAVRRVRPELAPRVVFMTGGAFTDEVRAFLRSSTNPFLDKPIDPERLRALVRDVASRRLTRSSGAP